MGRSPYESAQTLGGLLGGGGSNGLRCLTNQQQLFIEADEI